MALDVPGLKAMLLEAQQAARHAATVDEAMEIWVDKVAEAIDTYVRTGDVPVTTIGSATTQAGTGKIV